MPTKKKTKARARDDSFESVAKRLGADEDMGKFLKKLGKIAKAKASTKKATS
jgi:hypothetical protein